MIEKIDTKLPSETVTLAALCSELKIDSFSPLTATERSLTPRNYRLFQRNRPVGDIEQLSAVRYHLQGEC
jgi:hypothetical protein